MRTLTVAFAYALAAGSLAAGCGAPSDMGGPPRIGEATCGHDLCASGPLVDSACHPCAAAVCAIDSFCCEVAWDRICIGEIEGMCDESCPAACGDGICGGGEDCASCALDCGACPSCGNDACEFGEDCASCAPDCGSCPSCSHDPCIAGDPLGATCDSCTAAVCAADDFCCTIAWDLLCVHEAVSVCLISCGGACGNAVVDPGEVCDDGNTVSGDGCSADCLSIEACGNGILDVADGEVCDDGNNTDGDGCSANCRSDETCGNGLIDPAIGELCDDGNNLDGDGCSADCLLEGNCGNGVVDIGEECDDGAGGVPTSSATCDADCTVAFCGDAFVNPIRGEQCDTAGATPACDADCTARVCGDGYVNPSAGEVCDDGNTVTETSCPYGTATCTGCSSDCASALSLTGPFCGDGFVTGPEACDDANSSNTDACLNTCQSATCGDGFVRAGFEGCDDGNTINTDACPSSCQPAYCGDGFVHTGLEQCDTAGETPSCDSDCTPPICGDGHCNPTTENPTTCPPDC